MVFLIGRRCAVLSIRMIDCGVFNRTIVRRTVLSIGIIDCGIFNRTTVYCTVHRDERLWYF